MFRVEVPSGYFEGKRCGVQFRKGVATVEDEATAKRLEELGYKVTKLAGEATEAKEAAEEKEAPKRKRK
jgi:hypothetical protein